MEVTCRLATPADLDEVAALTRTHRHRLATWGPRWWGIGEGADDLHPLWLGHLIGSDQATVRVAVADADIVATAVSVAQGDHWFIDDIAIADDNLWPHVAPALVRAVGERPGLTCVASADRARGAALHAEGSTIASSYWVRGTTPPLTTLEGPPRAASPRDAPPHTFGPPFAAGAPGALYLSDDTGTLVGSPSTPAPPVYDPGGPVTVVDRIDGDDLDALLATAVDRTARRGDALIAVVCAPDDEPLQAALTDGGWHRTVDVHHWPAPRP